MLENHKNLLFIAEKPQLAQAIAEAYTDKPKRGKGFIDVGNNIKITWCFGHMLSLKSPEDHDPKINAWSKNSLPFSMLKNYEYKISEGKEEQLNIILDLMKKYDTIVHAGDPDDEGQRIVDSILEFSKAKNKTVKRVLINDFNTQVVKKELGRMQENDKFFNLSQRALSRVVADQIFGFNLTVAYTVKNGMLLNVGRVATPILALIVNREKAHKNHAESYYYNLFAKISNGIELEYQAPKEMKNEDGNIDDKSQLEAIALEVKGRAQVEEYRDEITKKQPPLLYNLLKLQADCSKLYGYTPIETQDITQTLREKYRLITYNRTDSQYLNDEHHEEAPEVIEAIINNLTDYKKLELDSSQKTRVFNTKKVTNHHAIIPTIAKPQMSLLTEKEKTVYELIAKRYLAQFMAYREVQTQQLTIDVNGHKFKITSSNTIKRGWLDLVADESEKEKPRFPEFQKGDYVDIEGNEIKKSKTKPPRLYTEDSLLEDLTRVARYVSDPELKTVLIDRDKGKEGEQGGIGTPATRAGIIENLKTNEFIELKGKNLIATEKGHRFYEILPQNLKSPDLTAKWEIHLEQIENGEKTYDEFIEELNNVVTQDINYIFEKTEFFGEVTPCLNCGQATKRFEKNKQVRYYCSDCKVGFKKDESGKLYKLEAELTKYKCKKCDSFLTIRNGAKGKFYSCSGYPKCKTAYNVGEDGAPAYPVISEHKCQKCEKPLIIRDSAKGKFYSCSAYPKCKTAYKIGEDGAPLYPVISEHKCPECSSPLIERKGKNGEFYGCSSFPKCRYTCEIDEKGNPKK